MAYIGSDQPRHDSTGKTGVLLVNLGTPAAPTAGAVRPWLRQFLGDPRVVEVPRLIWWFILNCIILLVRPARSARNYQKIWTEEGSPLLVHTLDQVDALKKRFENADVEVDYAFSYGEPSISAAIQSLIDRDTRRLLVLPLFPQYSATTAGTVFDAVSADLSRRRWVPDFRFISHYHDHPAYIEALADSIRSYREAHGSADKLVMSFHGAPRFQLDKGDPYYCECQKTGRLLAQALDLGEEEYQLCFQSRFGAAKWLEPYTDVSLQDIAKNGTRSVQVVCPGFSVDCLETLEEIAMENRELFLEAGGQSYDYIPCLNAETAHIDFLQDLIEENSAGW